MTPPRSMHRSVSICLLALAGCQTPPQGTVGAPEPRILSIQFQDGKGVPYGRSDADAFFYRSIRLPVSSDPSFGFSEAKPVRTGPGLQRMHIQFLNSLRGPQGEPVEYERKGSCCSFVDQRLQPLGGGLLDVYRIKIDGAKAELLLFVDMYRPGLPNIPMGFTQRQ